ncbi:hypothetical protein P8C59_002980 [Phyllachora maydis]|uniref:YDG domain-containing protein n=1 Tax=Phyllachora maydis TaxID=1825666 RepID=A0AAD9HZR6_9PEZI|nr:hypothetical protein P8C59_002980 [Phyllachora maydis]
MWSCQERNDKGRICSSTLLRFILVPNISNTQDQTPTSREYYQAADTDILGIHHTPLNPRSSALNDTSPLDDNSVLPHVASSASELQKTANRPTLESNKMTDEDPDKWKPEQKAALAFVKPFLVWLEHVVDITPALRNPLEGVLQKMMDPEHKVSSELVQTCERVHRKFIDSNWGAEEVVDDADEPIDDELDSGDDGAQHAGNMDNDTVIENTVVSLRPPPRNHPVWGHHPVSGKVKDSSKYGHDELDVDRGEELWYSADGGSISNTNRNAIASLSSGTRALQKSIETKRPVRVLRSVGVGPKSTKPLYPSCGIRYDGLYEVTDVKTSTNSQGGLYRRFRLRRCPDQVSLDQVQRAPSLQQRADFERIREGY